MILQVHKAAHNLRVLCSVQHEALESGATKTPTSPFFRFNSYLFKYGTSWKWLEKMGVKHWVLSSSLRIEQFRLKGTVQSHLVQLLYRLYHDRNWSLNVNNRLGWEVVWTSSLHPCSWSGVGREQVLVLWAVVFKESLWMLVESVRLTELVCLWVFFSLIWFQDHYWHSYLDLEARWVFKKKKKNCEGGDTA